MTPLKTFVLRKISFRLKRLLCAMIFLWDSNLKTRIMDTMQIRDRPIGRHTWNAYARCNGKDKRLWLVVHTNRALTCQSTVNQVDRSKACNNAAIPCILHVQFWISVLWRTWRSVYRDIKWNHICFRLRRTVNLENRWLRPHAILTL